MIALTPRNSLFPYTTLFRSGVGQARRRRRSGRARALGVGKDQQRSARGCPGRGVVGAARAGRSVDGRARRSRPAPRSEEHTSELQSRENLVCRLLLEKKNKN